MSYYYNNLYKAGLTTVNFSKTAFFEWGTVSDIQKVGMGNG
jgi:hypothetical protein